jgi:hypothetical protein
MDEAHGLPITTPRDLCTHLQWAVEVELSTIPLYLTALFSIEEDSNREVQSVLRSVVMEEMLHMCLAANLLHAVRGSELGPRVTGSCAPTYPGTLMHSDGIELRLQSYGHAAIDLFCAIEKPPKLTAPPQSDRFDTLGQFYEAITDGFTLLHAELGPDLFPDGAHVECQVQPGGAYYGGGGDAIVVRDIDSALSALHEIIWQGEGAHGTVLDGDHALFGEAEELAHYYRFDELRKCRRYRMTDDPDIPTGPPILFDASAVRTIDPDLHSRLPSDAPPDLPRLLRIFDHTYQALLVELEAGLNGNEQRLVDAVPLMYQLEYQGRALTKIPVGDDLHAGPLFRAVSP